MPEIEFQTHTFEIFLKVRVYFVPLTLPLPRCYLFKLSSAINWVTGTYIWKFSQFKGVLCPPHTPLPKCYLFKLRSARNWVSDTYIWKFSPGEGVLCPPTKVLPLYIKQWQKLSFRYIHLNFFPWWRGYFFPLTLPLPRWHLYTLRSDRNWVSGTYIWGLVEEYIYLM